MCVLLFRHLLVNPSYLHPGLQVNATGAPSSNTTHTRKAILYVFAPLVYPLNYLLFNLISLHGQHQFIPLYCSAFLPRTPEVARVCSSRQLPPQEYLARPLKGSSLFARPAPQSLAPVLTSCSSLLACLTQVIINLGQMSECVCSCSFVSLHFYGTEFHLGPWSFSCFPPLLDFGCCGSLFDLEEKVCILGLCSCFFLLFFFFTCFFMFQNFELSHLIVDVCFLYLPFVAGVHLYLIDKQCMCVCVRSCSFITSLYFRQGQVQYYRHHPVPYYDVCALRCLAFSLLYVLETMANHRATQRALPQNSYVAHELATYSTAFLYHLHRRRTIFLNDSDPSTHI